MYNVVILLKLSKYHLYSTIFYVLYTHNGINFYLAIGYYRVNYDLENWKLIVNYLNSEEYWKIDVTNRAQIIDDAYHLMMVQKLDHRIFMDLLTYLSREKDYVAWYPMLKIFEYLSPFLPFRESSFLQVPNKRFELMSYFILRYINTIYIR